MSARDKIGTTGLAAVAVVVAGFAAVVMLLTRAWRRRLLARPAEARFARALAAVIALTSITLIAPAVVIVAVLAFESLGVVAAPLSSIGYGIAAAIAVARFGRGASAPGVPTATIFSGRSETCTVRCAVRFSTRNARPIGAGRTRFCDGP